MFQEELMRSPFTAMALRISLLEKVAIISMISQMSS
jgi:hypothetical protein